MGIEPMLNWERGESELPKPLFREALARHSAKRLPEEDPEDPK
jgi:hypothetical protein